MAYIQITPVTTRRELRAFVKFPWRIYKNDPNWVPPLISERLEYLDPATGPFYAHAEVALFMARRGQVVGTIAPFVDHNFVAHVGRPEGGFGFFESVDDLEVAQSLVNAARDWLRARGMAVMRGPSSFSDNDCPGILIDGADCPPVMLEAHTPRYYASLLERCGAEQAEDLYAWRAHRDQIGRELENLPEQLIRVAEVARKMANVTIRCVRLEDWDQEIGVVRELFTTTLHNMLQRAPYSEAEFRRLADRMRPFLDPDLGLIAEVEGRPVGFCIAMPDVNRVLIHLNGRLFPFGWLRARRQMRKIDVVTFKMMGVLPEYRRRGIDALLYLEAVKKVYDKGYTWLDGSVTSELNTVINMIALRLGAERYKHYRVYNIAV